MNYLTRWQRPEVAGWTGFGRLSSLRDEIDRLFDAPLAALTVPSQLLSGWSPALDVFETKDSLIVKAELPGMKHADIEVSLHNGSLTISGERTAQENHKDAEVYRSERFVGRFLRTVTLPASVDGDQVNADYKDGVLTITLPKTEEAKPKQINVNVS